MAIEPIQNGESGLSVRQKLNALIGAVKDGAGVEYIDGKIEELQNWIDENVVLVAEEAVAEAERLAEELTGEQEVRVAEAMSAANNARAMRDTIREMAAQAAEQGYEDFKARQELRTQLNAEVGRFVAHFDERIIVAADDLVSVAQRVTELSTKNENLSSKLILVEKSLTDQTSSLSQTIASLAVGTNTQFDHVAIWYFDTTTEGWTGYPLPPTVTTGGWLRPKNNGEYVQSPGIEVDGDKYQQIRARIRRVGNPVWKGEFWWGGTSTPEHVEPEPGWGDDRASLSIDLPWSGKVTSLRMNLAANTDSDYIEIDWIAIGRPTPGASSAEVQELRRAYIDADVKLAERVTTVYADMTTKEDGQATADAVDKLTARVEDTEDGLVLIGEDITAIRLDLGDKASTDAVDELVSRIDEFDDGSTVAQAQNTRVLRSAMRGLALEGLQGANRAFLDTRSSIDAMAEASNNLGSRIDAADGSLKMVAQDVTLLKLEIPQLAKVRALDALRTRLVVNEKGIEAEASRITKLEIDLPKKATVTALDALTLRVKDTEDGLGIAADDITQLKIDVPKKATVTALDALTLRVKDTEDGLVIAAEDVRQLKIDVPKKATVTALDALTSRVDDTEDGLSSMAESITALDTTVGRYSASGRFRVTVEATPTGALSRIGLKAAVSSTDGDRSAALFLEAVTGGLSRVIVVAGHFAVAAGATSTRVYPFYVTDGVVYIDTAYIRELTVERLHIANGSITVLNDAFTAASVAAGSSLPTVQTLVMTKGRSDPLPIWYSVQPSGISTGYTWAEVTLQLLRNGTVIDTTSYEFQAGLTATERKITMPFVDTWPGTGPVTYTVKARVQCWRRGYSNGSGGTEETVTLTGYGTVSNRFIGAFNAYK